MWPRPFLPVRDDEDDSDLHVQVEDLEEVYNFFFFFFFLCGGGGGGGGTKVAPPIVFFMRNR